LFEARGYRPDFMSPRLALLVIAAVFVILNADITTVNVALVTVGKDLHSDLEDLQWGLNSYMLAFAALIVAAGKPGLTGDRKLHFVGLLDYFRGLQNFEANHATVVAEIGNHPRTNLVTFLYARVPQRNGEGVCFFVVFSFHVAHQISRTSMSCKASLRR
jgi:MFS family permease